MYQPSGLDLPTMYDLPSEEVGDPVHRLQAHLIEKTCQLETIPPDRYLISSDLNLYYDLPALSFPNRSIP